MSSTVDVDIGLVICACETEINSQQSQLIGRKNLHKTALLASFNWRTLRKYTEAQANAATIKHFDDIYPYEERRIEYIRRRLNAFRLHSGDVVRLSIDDANLIHDLVVEHNITLE